MHTTVGGPAQTYEAPGLTITKVAVGPMDNNAYLLEADGEALLVDAANDPDTLLALLEQRTGGKLDMVVTTHSHWDHWQGLAAVVAATGARTAAHPLDSEPLSVQPDLHLWDGSTVSVGLDHLTAIHLAGHTPGSVALLWQGGGEHHLFTGDCLFPGGVGNTQKDPVRFASLMHDVRTKVFDRLPDTTVVHPGHGDGTTLGTERPHLDEWEARGW